MKFTLDSNSIECFKKEKRLTIATFYTEQQLKAINALIDPTRKLEDKKDGHNLSLRDEKLRKALNLYTLAILSYMLCRIKPLRLAYDQLFTSSTAVSEKPLMERFCVSDLEMVIKIDLMTGDLVFLHPEALLEAALVNEKYLMILFTRHNSLYRRCTDDPKDPYLKKRGYAYGDKLKDADHPVLLRDFNG